MMLVTECCSMIARCRASRAETRSFPSTISRAQDVDIANREDCVDDAEQRVEGRLDNMSGSCVRGPFQVSRTNRTDRFSP